MGDKSVRDRAAAAAGRFASGSKDGSKNHDKYLAEAYGDHAEEHSAEGEASPPGGSTRGDT